MKGKVKCYKCKEDFPPRKDIRERCPRCGTYWWRTPTLADRLREAWASFRSPW